MTLDPRLLVAVGDLFLNLSAGWFGAAVIFPGTSQRSSRDNVVFVVINLILGVAALVFGYRLRILEL